jgi:PKD repeat protein
MIYRIKLGLVLIGFAAMTSCQYEEIAKANYPDELIYLPAALQGIYSIDNLPTATLAVPTPGNPTRFTVNTVTNEFNVPLAVYRSGISDGKTLMVDIVVNADTINNLIVTDTVNMKNTEVLPTDKYSLPSSVQVEGGSDLGPFNLIVDMDFLKANVPRKYALGVTISSVDCKSNPSYKTVIILIDTRIMIPAPKFTFVIDNPTHKVTFTNSTNYGVSYSWDFGDNSTSAELNPVHTFAATGDYNVTIHATGLAGNVLDFTSMVKITN